MEIQNDAQKHGFSSHEAIFEHVQRSSDIISSVLILHKYIIDNDIETTLNLDKLRMVGLRSCDNETSTYLWHLNAVFVASSNFDSLLLGFEVLFERFLGNKSTFLIERKKYVQNASNVDGICTASVSPKKRNKNKHQFVSNEVISVVTSYYGGDSDGEENEGQEADSDPDLKDAKQSETSTMKFIMKNDELIENDENFNSNEVSMQYNAQISSPISFRMRQQKRVMQKERRFKTKNNKTLRYQDDRDANYDENRLKAPLSPFNIGKFVSKVDKIQSQKI
jgi:hypothetical protein